MFFIIVIIVVVVLFISCKNNRETITISGGNIKQETKISNMDNLEITKIDDNTKTIYLITSSDITDGEKDIKDIINNFSKRQKR